MKKTKRKERVGAALMFTIYCHDDKFIQRFIFFLIVADDHFVQVMRMRTRMKMMTS